MHIDPARLWKSDIPAHVVVLDAECRYDHEAHGRYLAAERFSPADVADLDPRDRRYDPRVTPRWPCQKIVTLSWLVLTDGDDGLRPVRMETRGCPEFDEAGIVAAFLADMAQLGRVQLTSWGGFHADMPRIMLAAVAAGLHLPPSLAGLHSPWRREASGHCDLMSEMCGGAKNAHLAEIAAKLGVPAKITCRPDQVSSLMAQGKWSSVKAVAEGDVLSTALLLMRWRHLLGGSVSTLEATQRLTAFVAEHLSHRSYAADWERYGAEVLRQAFALEAAKVEGLVPSS